ncbi:Pre-mRNA-splicing factor cef1, partial [Spiromyces aspiralis]
IEEEERLKEIKRKREKQKNVENPAALHNRQKAERIAAAAQAEKEEAEQLAKRKKLQLPAPQITDQDLETILQIGQQGETARELVQSEHTASGTLLGDYTTATPGHDIAARTPRINTKHDTVMAEARNLRALAVQQTPLLGEENPVIQESQGTGFDGVTPRSSLMQTPNPLMTPMRGGDSAGQSVFAAPGATPMRDELGLNAGTPFSPRAGGLHRAGKDLRVQLAKKLAKLPAPRNEFEIIVPEQPSPEQGAESSKQIESDQEAVDKMRRERLRAEEEARLRRRSQAVQRDLPRPASFESLEAAHDKLARLANEGDVTAQIQRLILEELERMVLYDAANHPVPHSRPPKRQIHMEPISDEDLQWARDAVTEELNNNPIPAEVVIEASNLWKGYEGSMVWVASKNEYLPKDELTEEDWVDKFRAEWKSRRERMTKEADRAAKIEKRLGIKLGGYQARAKVLAQSITKAHEECDQAYRDLELFRSLKRAEDASIPSRLESAEAEVREVERREDELQSRYSELVRRRQALLEQIQAASNGEVAT